ncbi:nitroreductase family protein [candidate division FCPU426 bacterium]|nr:nitroreductase family protein [candidate division FCPU426 bacterium]
MNDFALSPEIQAARANDYHIQPLIIGRWSPRAFSPTAVPEEDLLAVLDAAHWAPSCFNEQPWRFVVARRENDLQRMRECLVEQNRLWAGRAPVLIAVLSVPLFQQNGQPNRWHAFDAGTAWGYMALEARARNLFAHAMGGFTAAKVMELFHVPDNWTAQAIVALGYRGPADQLSKELQVREQPQPRRPLREFWQEGPFPA